MTETAIFGPFLTMMLLTLVVWVYLFVRRIRFISGNAITPEQMTGPGALDRITPQGVLNPSDNFKNLFEVPVLFYALTLYLFATGQVDGLYVTLGWIFVGFRALHSFVHCTFNHILARFWIYFVSSVALWVALLRAAFNVLNG